MSNAAEIRRQVGSVEREITEAVARARDWRNRLIEAVRFDDGDRLGKSFAEVNEREVIGLPGQGGPAVVMAATEFNYELTRVVRLRGNRERLLKALARAEE